MRHFFPRARLQVWKNGGNFDDRVNQKFTNFICFPIFPVSGNILVTLMESWCIVLVGNQFFSHKIKVSEPFILRGIREISVRRHIFSLFVYFIHIVENLSAGKGNFVFLTVKCRKKSCLTNQGKTKRDIRSPPFFTPWQTALLPVSRASDAQKVAQYDFPL